VIVCESFVVADWTDPGTEPRRPIAGLHLHRADDEAWFVLTGRLGFRVGEQNRELEAGESLLVRRGTPHSYWNAIPAPTRYLLVMSPRIHKLIVDAPRRQAARRRADLRGARLRPARLGSG
jgi:uncharacterized cupin superfamily protein